MLSYYVSGKYGPGCVDSIYVGFGDTGIGSHKILKMACNSSKTSLVILHMCQESMENTMGQSLFSSAPAVHFK